MNHYRLQNILNPIQLKKLSRSWINEDVPSFDIQGLFAGDKIVSANIFLKQSAAVLAGTPFVDSVFEEIGLDPPKWTFEEGTLIEFKPDSQRIIVGNVQGPAKLVLLAERTILNVLSRCSGIATNCHKTRKLLNQLNWNGELVGTRKTTPGFRMVEKYGLLVGNAGTHRYDLSSMVMLKDNQVELSGHQMADMIQQAKKCAGFSYKIEVECSSYHKALIAAENGADIIMLDNMEAKDSIEVSRKIKSRFPNILIEASGGINLQNINQYATEEFDIISMSSLIQGSPCIDYSMKIDPNSILIASSST